MGLLAFNFCGDFLFSFNICRSVPGPDVGGPDQGEQGEAEPRPAASHGHHGLQQ